jgi:hypothetical protein
MKVNVRRVQTGMAAASALLAATGAGTMGCAVDSEATSDEQDLTGVAANPGSAQIELQPGPTGGFGTQLLNSTTDEFVRVGETIKVVLPAWLVWETLYPTDPIPDDTRLKKLKLTVKASFLDKTTTLSSKTLTVASWTGTSFGLNATSTQLVIPAKTDSLTLTITVKDGLNAAASVTIGAPQLGPVPVFGGALPGKSLLLDNTSGVLRQRVVDGDLLVKGSTATIGFSDWRADQIVGKTNLDLQIGTASFNGRFGPQVSPIYGTLSYVVSYAVSFDGGQTFHPEKTLAPSAASRLLGPGRTDYEATEAIPASATQMLFYGHVKAVLTADYTPYPSVTQKFYADNQQVQLKDAYDNPSGPFTNYAFPLQ